MGILIFVLELYLAVTLGVSGLAKVADLSYFESVLKEQRILPLWSIQAASRISPWVEIALAFFLITGFFTVAASLLVVALFAFFLGIKLFLLKKKNGADCGCLGRVNAQKVDGASVGASVILLLVAGIHFWLVMDIAPIYWVWRAIGVIFVGGIMGMLLGRIIVKKRLPLPAPALPNSNLRGLDIGEQAPVFVARDQYGNAVRLEDFRGQNLLLTFVSPGCPACPKALTALKQVLPDEAGVVGLIMSGADTEHNRAYAAEQKVDIPLLTVDLDLLKQYGVDHVPFVYLLDEAGRVQAKGVVNLAEHLQALLRTTAQKVVAQG